MLSGLASEEYLWKSAPEKWCLLEVVCHLLDEEREDFKYRLKHVLENPDSPMPPIDPQGWVGTRKYLEQDYEKTLYAFIQEREQSISWLQSLSSPDWNNTYHHPKLGPLSAELFLNNWLAHDYLHIRQALSIKYNYFNQHSDTPLAYAGEW